MSRSRLRVPVVKYELPLTLMKPKTDHTDLNQGTSLIGTAAQLKLRRQKPLADLILTDEQFFRICCVMLSRSHSTQMGEHSTAIVAQTISLISITGQRPSTFQNFLSILERILNMILNRDSSTRLPCIARPSRSHLNFPLFSKTMLNKSSTGQLMIWQLGITPKTTRS